jgi:hypothetical protein
MSGAVALVTLLKHRAAAERQRLQRAPLIADARLLIQALQNEEIDSAELVKLLNSEKEFDAEYPEEDELVDRTRRIFKHLDVNQDGKLGLGDLEEVKGRLYTTSNKDDQDSIDNLKQNYLTNEKAVHLFKSRAEAFVRHRAGYGLCCLHIFFFFVFTAVLALQADMQTTFDTRSAITKALMPEEVFGQDMTMVDSLVLQSYDVVQDWFETAFLDTENGVFSDAACGDGVCDEPLEFASWQGEDGPGCEIDCGAWAPTVPTANRRVKVELAVDPTLAEDEVLTVRWNLLCPTVKYFEEQLRYFDEDQTLAMGDVEEDVPAVETAAFDSDSAASSSSGGGGNSGVSDTVRSASWTLLVFDCDWELRLYAPHGGVNGTLTYSTATGSGVSVVSTGVSDPATNVVASGANSRRRSTRATYEWAGCEAPLPKFNEVLGCVVLSHNTQSLTRAKQPHLSPAHVFEYSFSLTHTHAGRVCDGSLPLYCAGGGAAKPSQAASLPVSCLALRLFRQVPVDLHRQHRPLLLRRGVRRRGGAGGARGPGTGVPAGAGGEGWHHPLHYRRAHVRVRRARVPGLFRRALSVLRNGSPRRTDVPHTVRGRPGGSRRLNSTHPVREQ